MHEHVLYPHLSLSFCYPLLHAWACLVPTLIIKFLLSPTSSMILCCPHVKFLLSPTSCISLCCPHTYHSVSAIPYFMHKLVLLPVRSLRCVLSYYCPCDFCFPTTDLVVFPIISLTLWCLLPYHWPCGVSYPITYLVVSPILSLTLWCLLAYHWPCGVC